MNKLYSAIQACSTLCISRTSELRLGQRCRGTWPTFGIKSVIISILCIIVVNSPVISRRKMRSMNHTNPRRGDHDFSSIRSGIVVSQHTELAPMQTTSRSKEKTIRIIHMTDEIRGLVWFRSQVICCNRQSVYESVVRSCGRIGVALWTTSVSCFETVQIGIPPLGACSSTCIH